MRVPKSGRATSPHQLQSKDHHLPPILGPGSRLYSTDASLVVIGFPGAGKKTLGIIASVALRRRYISFETFFELSQGASISQYISIHGSVKFRETELRVTSDLLKTHQKGCVITGITVTGSRLQRQLLQNFARTHPVAFVRRQREDIHQHMSVPEDKFHRLYDIGVSLYESCSNFDFYNLSQPRPDLELQPQPETLKLKHAERYFIRFLSRVFGQPPQLVRSPSPLSQSYTHALQVPLSWLKNEQYYELECGADALTLIVDQKSLDIPNIHYQICKQLAIIKRRSRLPVILDVKMSSEKDQNEYYRLVETGLRSVPDYVTLDLSLEKAKLRSLTSRVGHTKIIGTHHFKSTWTDDKTTRMITSLQESALSISASALLLTGSATTIVDDLDCRRMVQVASEKLSIPLIGYNLGEAARPSQWFSPTLSPVTLCESNEGGTTLPEAQAVLFASGNLRRKKFTLMGESVNYSLSPAMHNAGYAACGLPHVYEGLQANDIGQINQLLQDPECGGVVVSMPFKTEVLSMLDEWEPEVQDIGAANTVLVKRTSDSPKYILRGVNTDFLGQKECVERALSPANAVTIHTTALIIGAGGMARAAIYACHKLGVRNVFIHNRTLSRARELAEYYNRWSAAKNGRSLRVSILDRPQDSWPNDFRQPTIIIACIPAHSIGGRPASTFQIPEQWLQSRTGGVFVDLAYKPLVTPLLQQMQPLAIRGWISVSGLSVLLEQGVIQYEYLTGRAAPVHDMKRAIRMQVEKYPEHLA